MLPLSYPSRALQNAFVCLIPVREIPPIGFRGQTDDDFVSMIK